MTSKQKREAAQARHQFTAQQINAKASDLIFSLRLLRWDADGLLGTHCYAARKECDSAMTALENLRGKAVIVQAGGIMDDFLIKEELTSNIIRVQNPLEALMLLNSGQYDAALLNKLQEFRSGN